MDIEKKKIHIKDSLYFYLLREYVVDFADKNRKLISLTSPYFTKTGKRDGTLVKVYEIKDQKAVYICTKSTGHCLFVHPDNPGHWYQFFDIRKISFNGVFNIKKFAFIYTDFYVQNKKYIVDSLLQFDKKPITTRDDFMLLLAEIKARKLRIIN